MRGNLLSVQAQERCPILECVGRRLPPSSGKSRGSGMRQLDESQLFALVSLLTDDTPSVSAGALQALREAGVSAIPCLRGATASEDAKLRARARLVLEEIRIHVLEEGLREVGARLGKDPRALEDGCIILAMSRYPDLDESSIRAALDAMADDLQTRLRGCRSAMTIAQILSRFFAGELGFSGNQRNYHDAENSYINRVLERRIGIPITLSAIYLFVARRTGVPLHGVGMPGHFILRLGLKDHAIFIDPFEAGRILSRADCIQRLEESRSGYDPVLLAPMTDGAILLRMIRNLQLVYRNRGEMQHWRVLERLKNVLLKEASPTSKGSTVDGPNLHRPES